jgi:diacylglycerol kinase family enzyme
MARTYAAQDCEVQLDDQTLCAHCLAVHVLNLPFVGPHLMLAPGADPGDGQFDVVIIDETRRQTFVDFVASGGRSQHGPLFPVHRSRTVTLRWAGAEAHVDDEVHQIGEPAELSAQIVPSALTFLVPKNA